MALTGLTAIVDLEEYSRFEKERDTIIVTISPAGDTLSGEVITVQLMRARRGRDEITASLQVTLTADDPEPIDTSFELAEITDEDEVPRVRRGDYFVRVISVTTPAITDDTPDFFISLISVERMKADYLHGTDQLSTDTLAVLMQPTVVTGVEITNVSRGHPQKWYPLSYNYSDDGTNITRTLSWCKGAVVPITGPGTYTLRRGTATDYVQVRVGSLLSMPTESHAEDLLVERKPFTDQRIRDFITQAISWLEDSAIAVYLEPTVVCTEIDPDTISFTAGTDIPAFVGATWDKKVDALMYTVPASGHWIGFDCPYYPLLRFDELFGKLSNTRIVDIALEWIEIHEKTGWVELVPFNQEVAFNFIGLVWIESLRGPVPLPNFWNFTAVVGFRKTPPILIEMAAKKAAMDILTIAGQAFRGGISSQSVSRDGVSESVSYTASAMYGVYSASVEDYRKFIDANLKELRGAFRGPNMVVM